MSTYPEEFKALEEENERLKAKNEESKESMSQCHQAYHKTSVYYRNRIKELETTLINLRTIALRKFSQAEMQCLLLQNIEQALKETQ